MKKYLSIFILSLVVIPSVALASWWNPVSWFNNWSFSKETEIRTEILQDKIITPTTTPQYSHFYIKYDNTRVRACKSLQCDVLGYYKKNEYVYVLGSENIDSLEEWVTLHTTDSGQEGYLNKSVLSATPVTQITEKPQVTSIVKDKTPIQSGKNLVLTTIDVQIIASDKESIEYLKSEILNINKFINLFTKFKQSLIDTNNNAPKSVVIGDRYSKLADILIDSLEVDIQYFNSVISQYTNMIEIFNKHIAVAQENRKIFESKIYENDRAELNDAKFFFEQSQKDKDILFEAYDISKEYSRYYLQQYSFYQKALADFKNLLNSDRVSLSQTFIPPTYIRPVPPVVPMTLAPKISHCTISPLGGGGVDLVVSCY